MKPGVYQAKIMEHGTDMTGSGLPFIWIDVEIADGPTLENGRCKLFLAGKDEAKSATAIRMARQGLKLCGFDPDTQDISTLDDAPTLLAGNMIPVKVSEREYQGKFYPNFDIHLPRGVDKKHASSLTAALRAAKSKDEAPAPAPPKAPQSGEPWKPKPGPLVMPAEPDDIPF